MNSTSKVRNRQPLFEIIFFPHSHCRWDLLAIEVYGHPKSQFWGDGEARVYTRIDTVCFDSTAGYNFLVKTRTPTISQLSVIEAGKQFSLSKMVHLPVPGN